jgi:LCP family protein required for cell wall assembly
LADLDSPGASEAQNDAEYPEGLQAEQPAPPRRGRKRLLLGGLAVVALVALALFGYVKYKGGFGNAIAPFLPSPNLVQVFGKQNLRILVMGLDENWTESDESYTAGARTDTLIGLNINLVNKQISVLSIPRDLWVYIPKDGYGKINEAYGDGGPERTEATVVKNLGTPPFDYYVVLRLDATKNIINAIGGLNLYVEKDMDYDDSWGHLHIHLHKGYQHLNGDQVVGYVRFRHDPEGDFGRMRRQRQVMEVLAQRLRDPNIALHLPALLEVIKDNVRTNMPFGKLYDLALGLRGTSKADVHTSVLPVEIGWTNGESVLFADSNAAQVVHKYLALGWGSQFDPSNVHVGVENGSGTPGAASAMADFLRQRGFDVIETGNAPTFNHPTTIIETADQKVAGEVAKALPVKNPRINVGPVSGVDVMVVVGRDYSI